MDTQTNGIYLTLITGLVFVTLLLVFFILSLLRHQRNRMVSYRQQVCREIELIDRERERIANDLHDELGSGIAAVGLLIEQAKEKPRRSLLEKAGRQLAQQRQKIREIAHGFIPGVLASHGLSRAISDLLEELRISDKVRFRVQLDINDSRFSPAKSVHVYRIIREVLINAVQHAGATEIRFTCLQDSQKITLRIRDNGSGFAPEVLHNMTQGWGMRTIHTRINLIGATLTLDSAIGSGTSYLIRIPLSLMYQPDEK